MDQSDQATQLAATSRQSLPALVACSPFLVLRFLNIAVDQFSWGGSARSTLHLCQIAETLREKGVDLVVLDQNIDTSDATGRLLFNMLGAIGQFETEIRAERQMDGVKKAKDRGVQFGKRPALTAPQIDELREKRADGMLIKDLMARYSLSKATIYRYLGTKGA